MTKDKLDDLDIGINWLPDQYIDAPPSRIPVYKLSKERDYLKGRWTTNEVDHYRNPERNDCCFVSDGTEFLMYIHDGKQWVHPPTQLTLPPEETNQWVSVNDKPIPYYMDDDILITMDGKTYAGYPYGKRFTVFKDGQDQDIYDWRDKITHWQLKPKPAGE